MYPNPLFLNKTSSEIRSHPVVLDPNRWKLHVSYTQTNNILYRIVNLEDLVKKAVYRINNLSEEDFQKVIASECNITFASYILLEYNVLGSLNHTTLTIYQSALSNDRNV
jgi:hypothetical protein